jgi:plastocyanin
MTVGRPSVTLLFAVLATVVAIPVAAGSVTGVVEVLGKNGEPYKHNGEVVVYLDGIVAKTPAQRERLEMKGKQFRPQVVVVGTGSTVEFPNADPILHNVFSVSGDNRFDLDLYKSPQSGEKIFEHAGIVRVYCNIHPQMSATIVVRNNPYFTLAEPSGAFRIDGVPPGRYTLKAWHRRATEEAVAEVVVPRDGNATATFSLDVSKYRRPRHKNKYGKKYKKSKY